MSKEYDNPPHDASLSLRQSNRAVDLLDPFEYVAEWLTFQNARDLGVFEVDDARDIDAHEGWGVYLDWQDHRDAVIRSESRPVTVPHLRISRLPRFQFDFTATAGAPDDLQHPFCWSPRYVHEGMRTSGESSQHGQPWERLSAKKCGQCPGCEARRVVQQAAKIACGLVLFRAAYYCTTSKARVETITRRIGGVSLADDCERSAWELVQDLLPEHLSVGHASRRFEIAKLFLADDDAKCPGGVILVSSVKPQSKRREERWRKLLLEPASLLTVAVRWAHRLRHGIRGQASTRGSSNWARETPTHRSMWYPHGDVDEPDLVSASLRSEGVQVVESQAGFDFERPENARTGDEAAFFNQKHNLRGTGAPSRDEHPLDSFGEEISEARDQFERALFRVFEAVDPTLQARARRAGRRVYDPDLAWSCAVSKLERFDCRYTVCQRSMLRELTYPIESELDRDGS